MPHVVKGTLGIYGVGLPSKITVKLVLRCGVLSPECSHLSYSHSGPSGRGNLSGKPDDWPQDMKEYVERCFTACESEEDKDRTEKLLKEVLQARLQDGSAYTIDWSREPLPGSVWVTL